MTYYSSFLVYLHLEIVSIYVTEREENVKSDIFHAYMALLKQTKPSAGSSLDPNCMEQEDAPLCLLQSQVCTVNDYKPLLNCPQSVWYHILG